MAPSTVFTKRDFCNGYYCDNYYGSGWDNWGRWVALVVIVVFFFLLAFLFTCTRRRRQRGMVPMYGTGWMPYTGAQQGHHNHQNKPPGQNANGQYYSHEPYGGAAPPPAYMGNQATGTTFRSADGYYGGPNGGNGGGIELQQPHNSYQGYAGRGGDSVYDPPTGAPPGKGDGIVR